MYVFMTAIKFENKIELRIWLPWFMQIYHTYFYNPIIPKVALTEHYYFWVSIADTIGLS